METPRTNKNAGYYCGHGIKKNSDLVIDPNGPFVLADFARELERENSRLRCAIQTAIDYANGRESECGERAEGAFAVLYSALANTGDEARRQKTNSP